MGVLTAIFNTLIILVSLFLIFLILIQRGKGGGLSCSKLKSTSPYRIALTRADPQRGQRRGRT